MLWEEKKTLSERVITMLQSVTLMRSAVMAAACIALNLSLGKVANLLQLPLYLDSIGTVLSAALVPPIFSVSVGALSSLANGVLIQPAYFFFIGTQISIAVVAILAFRRGWFATLPRALATGFLIALVAAAVSAPVVVIAFGGVTAPGVTAINAILLAAGKGLWTSVLTGAFFIESLDKMVSGGLVWLILQRLPERLRSQPGNIG
jgi:energy-coupling factor transport system substrate-specific component